MALYDTGSTCEGTPGNYYCSCGNQSSRRRRVEILAFIDPLCVECWALEPFMKKLHVEYGSYFTLRYLITFKHDESEHSKCRCKAAKKMAEEWDKYSRLTGVCCDSDVWLENPPSHYHIALAIKAAEFQGKIAGSRFLRRLREQVFLRKKGLNQYGEILKVARSAELDIQEFENDLHSGRPIKALQCDRHLASEMGITDLPSLVFSTADTEKEAIKVNGGYPYEVYVQILTDLIGEAVVPSSPPSMEDFFKRNVFLTTKEVAVVYDLSEQDVTKDLRKLQIKQIVEPVTLKSGTFWRYIR